MYKVKANLVSIIIPSYNSAQFLKKSIMSVIDQSYTNWEIIVVDNHSKDETDEIIYSFRDRRIKLLKVHNRGVIGVSRNLGIYNAEGKWIAFLDSDDWWYPEKLEASIVVLKNGADFVCHSEDWVKNGRIIKTVKYGPKENAIYSNLLFSKNCISTSASVILKDKLLEVGGFTENINAVGVEDYHLWIKLAKARVQLEFIDSSLGCYRLYNLSQSSNLIKQMKSEKWVVYDHFNKIDGKSFFDYIRLLKRTFRIYAATLYRWYKR